MILDSLGNILGLKAVLSGIAKKYGITDRAIGEVDLQFKSLTPLHLWILKYTNGQIIESDINETQILEYSFMINNQVVRDVNRIKNYCKKIKNYLTHKYPLVIDYKLIKLQRNKSKSDLKVDSFMIVRIRVPAYELYYQLNSKLIKLTNNLENNKRSILKLKDDLREFGKENKRPSALITYL